MPKLNLDLCPDPSMHQELQMQEQPEEQSHVQTITVCLQ